MSTLTIILIVASVMLGAGVLAVGVWLGYTSGWEKFARVGFREGVAPAHG